VGIDREGKFGENNSPHIHLHKKNFEYIYYKSMLPTYYVCK